jgi:hypothetical protein
MLLSRDTEARPCGSEEKFCDINLTLYNDQTTVEDRRIGFRLPAAAQCFFFRRSVRTVSRPAVNGLTLPCKQRPESQGA